MTTLWMLLMTWWSPLFGPCCQGPGSSPSMPCTVICTTEDGKACELTLECCDDECVVVECRSVDAADQEVCCDSPKCEVTAQRCTVQAKTPWGDGCEMILECSEGECRVVSCQPLTSGSDSPFDRWLERPSSSCCSQ